MKLRTIVSVLALLAVLSVAIAGYLHYSAIIESAMREAGRNADSQTNTLKNLVSSFLSGNQKAVAALAGLRPLQLALTSTDPETRERANAVLDRFQMALEVSVCYLMDRGGTTVASSNRNDPDSFVGKNYAFREYFQQSIQGLRSLTMALGVTSQKRGIYFGHPVYGNGDEAPMGVVVIKAPIEPLEEEFEQTRGGIVLFADSRGVIFASNRHDWVYRFMWEITPQEIARIAETRQFGDSPREWTGLRMTGEGHAVDGSGTEYLITQSAIQDSDGWQVFYLISHKEPYSGGVRALMRSSGPILMILGIFVAIAVSYLYWIASRDIAQKKEAEEALRESENKLRMIIEHSTNLHYSHTPDHVLTYLSPHTRLFFDCEPEEALVKWTEFATDHPINREGYVHTQRAIDTGERQPPFPLELIGMKGRRIWVEVNESPVVVKGRTIAMVGALSDITARKLAQDALRESEQRFRHIAEISPFPIAILETDGRYIFVNKRFIEVFGYTVEEIPTGKAWFRLAFPDPQYRKGAISDWLSDLEKSRTFEVRPREYIVRCKDGKFRDILFRPITIEGGKQFITYEDLTELRQIEQERLRLAKLESVGILAGGIAHDFNNLLTAIVGNISLAKIDPTRSDKVIARLEEAEKAAARAKDLTLQLLTFSKGGAPVKKAMFLQGMIQETCGLILSGSKSRCELDIVPDLWPAEVDEGQISQVITNVLINADQAMPTGGTIKLRAVNRTLEAGHSLPLEPGRYIRIAIGDEGVGIGSEHLPRVFDPYFTTKQGGSGLGLATVHSVVSKHGGYVTATSEIGHGTTIIIYLPVARGQVDGLAGLADSEALTKGKGKILVMDDEEMIRDLAGAILTHLGYDAEFAENGEQAIAQYEKAKATDKPFDAVLMDLTIRGGMGGQEAVAILRSMDPTVRAIVSSGYSHDPVMAEYRNYGFVGVLSKPYQIEELSEVLQRVLARTT